MDIATEIELRVLSAALNEAAGFPDNDEAVRLETTSATCGQYVATTAAFAIAFLGVVYLADHASGLTEFLFLAFCAIYAVALIVLLLKLLRRLCKGAFRSTIPILVSFVILGSAPFFYSQFSWLIDLSRLGSSYSFYRSVIEQTAPDANGNKRVQFDWGGGGIVPTTWDHSLIYVEGPDQSLPPESCGVDDRHRRRFLHAQDNVLTVEATGRACEGVPRREEVPL